MVSQDGHSRLDCKLASIPVPCSTNNVDNLYQPVYVHVQVMMGLSKVHLKPEQNNLQRLEYIPVL